MTEVLFKDVPVGAEFGVKDYFMYKDSETTAVFSGDQFPFDPQAPVWVEDDLDVVDEDWLAGVSCNPDAPEECESCQ